MTKTIFKAEVLWWDELKDDHTLPFKDGIFESREDAEFYVDLWLNGHNGHPAGPNTEIRIIEQEVL